MPFACAWPGASAVKEIIKARCGNWRPFWLRNPTRSKLRSRRRIPISVGGRRTPLITNGRFMADPRPTKKRPPPKSGVGTASPAAFNACRSSVPATTNGWLQHCRMQLSTRRGEDRRRPCAKSFQAVAKMIESMAELDPKAGGRPMAAQVRPLTRNRSKPPCPGQQAVGLPKGKAAATASVANTRRPAESDEQPRLSSPRYNEPRAPPCRARRREIEEVGMRIVFGFSAGRIERRLIVSIVLGCFWASTARALDTIRLL